MHLFTFLIHAFVHYLVFGKIFKVILLTTNIYILSHMKLYLVTYNYFLQYLQRVSEELFIHTTRRLLNIQVQHLLLSLQLIQVHYMDLEKDKKIMKKIFQLKLVILMN